jgi:hypothetical protein
VKCFTLCGSSATGETTRFKGGAIQAYETKSLGGLFASFTRPDNHNLAPMQIPKDLLGQVYRKGCRPRALYKKDLELKLPDPRRLLPYLPGESLLQCRFAA